MPDRRIFCAIEPEPPAQLESPARYRNTSSKQDPRECANPNKRSIVRSQTSREVVRIIGHRGPSIPAALQQHLG
jgi:hypothetical protein